MFQNRSTYLCDHFRAFLFLEFVFPLYLLTKNTMLGHFFRFYLFPHPLVCFSCAYRRPRLFLSLKNTSSIQQSYLWSCIDYMIYSSSRSSTLFRINESTHLTGRPPKLKWLQWLLTIKLASVIYIKLWGGISGVINFANNSGINNWIGSQIMTSKTQQQNNN